MHWKETVLDWKVRTDFLWKGLKTYKSYGDAETALFEHQAEISFKAGIKEVVDFIETQRFYHSPMINPEAYRYDLNYTKWQAKLKEWGVKCAKNTS